MIRDGLTFQHCDICDKSTHHIRYLGKAVNFLECALCGSSIVEHVKEELRKAGNN